MIKIFNREIESKKIISIGLDTLLATFRTVSIFKNPFLVLRSYFRSEAMESRLIELRNGVKIALSKHLHDILTVFIVFGRRDYGNVPRNGIVVDIGANIGTFALYAILNGAKKVYAIEPNSESYQMLLKNIAQNNFKATIQPIKLAVSDKTGDKVLIPKESSPYNAIQEKIDSGTADLMETVETSTLEAICIENNIPHIDLLKIDCEGAEFRIVPFLSPDLLARIKAMRMEYQDGDVKVILDHLHKHSYKIVKHEVDARMNGGMLWVENTNYRPGTAV
jgi:FkbM family methyltransferase